MQGRKTGAGTEKQKQLPVRFAAADALRYHDAMMSPVCNNFWLKRIHAALRGHALVAALLALLLLSACGGGGDTPTRTPVPTWTPTVGAPAAEQVAQQPAAEQPVAPIAAADTPVPQEPVVVEEPTQPPAAAPTDTLAPPTPEAPTNTPEPTAPPTETPTPEPTPTPNYAFDLETAEKMPTESLAANVVRLWLYAYSPSNFGLPGYTLRVTHNGNPLTVEEETTGGIPGQTRQTPGPWTRFANMSVILVEPQAGIWEVQLVDADGIPAGPPALFDLTADEVTRELYVRYQQR
jgi:hypothetical protein